MNQNSKNYLNWIGNFKLTIFEFRIMISAHEQPPKYQISNESSLRKKVCFEELIASKLILDLSEAWSYPVLFKDSAVVWKHYNSLRQLMNPNLKT